MVDFTLSLSLRERWHGSAVTERAVCGGRTQFIPTVYANYFAPTRRGDLWSPPPCRYEKQTITIPQAPDGASSLCSRAPLNYVYLCEYKVRFPIVGEEFPLPQSYSDSRGRLSLHLENNRLCSHIPKKALRGLGHSRKCPNDFFASFFFV